MLKNRPEGLDNRFGNMLTIVADDKIPYLRGALEPWATVRYFPGSRIRRADLAGADALVVRTRTCCSAELLEGTPVRFIATATSGHDHIDTAWCDAHSVVWASAPGCNAGSVQQYVASALAWVTLRRGKSMRGLTLGVVGAGHVGKRVAELGRILGMEVLVNDPPRARAEGGDGFVELADLLTRADLLTLHVPLNTDGPDCTLKLLDRQAFSLLKRGAWLINSSRGEVVAGEALREGLQNGILGGAVIDVWENEPVPDPALLGMVTLGTPHIAGYSADGKAMGTRMIVRSLGRFFGLPLDDWSPQDIPGPPGGGILSALTGRSPEELLAGAILATCNPEIADARLRNAPELFENLRENYPVRREFGAYRVRQTMKDTGLEKVFGDLGFAVEVPRSNRVS